MTDSEWRKLMQESPSDAYRALIDQYGNLVYAIVLSKLKDSAEREDIEDCVSDVFVEFFQSAEAFSPSGGSLKGYLSTIAKRTAVDAYRRITYRRNKTSSIEDEEVRLPHSPDNPEQETEQKLFNQRLWQIILGLGEPDSSIIIRQYYYRQTNREIGKILSMTAAAVQKRSVRARKRMKQILLEESYFAGKGDCCEKV
ncbi:MAG: sigma-70 family RNA polymerase sigma factor [Ruminococcus sp.]|nr:sigma-70 family RNA polymerase sigma factor [Ruminococcus sp.]